MVVDNPTPGAPRIHGELKMFGFEISERTVLRWVLRAPRSLETAKRWAVFLSNNPEAIAAMDFFTVPTLTFSVLYCFAVISCDRRRIVHWGVTRHSTSAWVVQQLREAFPTILRRGIWSSIGRETSRLMCSTRLICWVSSRSEPVSELRGTAELQSTRLALAVATYSIMSSS